MVTYMNEMKIKSLVWFRYLTFYRRGRSRLVLRYLDRVSGYSRQTVTRLVARYRKRGKIQRQCRNFDKTRLTRSQIGERRKPNPNGQPGYLRIDTVHPGDLDGSKGGYHINTMDEVT